MPKKYLKLIKGFQGLDPLLLFWGDKPAVELIHVHDSTVSPALVRKPENSEQAPASFQNIPLPSPPALCEESTPSSLSEPLPLQSKTQYHLLEKPHLLRLAVWILDEGTERGFKPTEVTPHDSSKRITRVNLLVQDKPCL